MNRAIHQNGFILMPVIIAIVLIATIAFLLNNQSTINVNETGDMLQAEQAENIARAGLAHARWGAQNSACAGDMAMTTVPFGQDSYSATVTTPGGGTTAYPNLTADQDAWIRGDNITTNQGGNATLHLREEAGKQEYALVRFDLSSLPAGSQINSAVARFYVVGNKGHPAGPVTLHRVQTDWTELGVTWETHGDKFDSAVLATIPAQPLAGDVWVEVNLTAQVQAWVNGGEPNYGIMLIPTGEGTHAEYISREGTASEQPRLDVIVGTGAATPATITATGTLAGNPTPANDITRTLTRSNVPAYQPPGNMIVQLGTDPGEDTLLDSFYDLRNYGGADYLQVHDNGSDWQQYPLIRFDLAGLPRGAAVRSAKLELRLLSLNAPGTASIHQVTRSWVEGTKSGGGTADGATWSTHDGSNPWTSAGGDINVPVVAETAINGGETWVSWEIAPLVERWLAGEPNHGLLIKPDGALKQAQFASKENATAGDQPKLIITYICECGSPCLAPQGSGTVMMVVVDPTNLAPDDAYKKALFESWGYTVNVMGENSNAAAYATAAASNDVFFISESVNVAQVGSRIKDVPIGVVSQDGSYNADLGFAGSSAWTVGAAINVTDTSHYITAVFPTGPLDIYSAGMEQLTTAGGDATGLQTLADTGGAGSLVVLDKGADVVGGGTAAGRRVMLPLGTEAKFNWDYLNSNGQLIVQRAIQWGAGNTAVTPAGNLLLIVGNAASPASKDLGYKALMESWGYVVTLLDDGESQANYDIAMAAADVIFASGSALGANMQDKATFTTKGLVNEVPGKIDNFGFSSVKSATANFDAFTSTDATHYITESFGGGPVTVFTSSLTNPVPSGTLAPGMTNVGEVSGTLVLGTLDSGATRYDSIPSQGRRAHLPFASAEATDLTADGETILKRSLEWAAGAGVVATTAPIAHWKLDETTGIIAVDSVGGHDGTLTNGPTWDTGQVDGALNFDGSNDYVNVPHDPGLNLTSALTISTWFRADSFGPGIGGYRTFVSKYPTTTTANYWFGTWQQELVFGFWSGGTWYEVFTTGLSLNTDQWYQAAVTFDDASDQVLLYIDGAQVYAGSIAVSPPVNSGAVTIGRSASGEYWDGRLDDIRFYDEVLTSTDIAALAALGSGGEPPPPSVCDGTFRDEFNAQNYSNSDGTLTWATDWEETGETTSPTGGDIRITNDVSDYQLLVHDDGQTIMREVDLTGATSATLSFEYRRENLSGSSDYVALEVSYDGGSNWSELDRFIGTANDASYTSISYSLEPSLLSANTRIRFLTPSNGMSNNNGVQFDNVQIQCSP